MLEKGAIFIEMIQTQCYEILSSRWFWIWADSVDSLQDKTRLYWTREDRAIYERLARV